MVPTPCIVGDRHARTLKAADPSSQPTLLENPGFPAAFQLNWTNDAHFWPYACYVGGQLSPVQIRVPVERGQPVGLGAGDAVLCHYLAFDYDEPGHQDADGKHVATEELLDMIPQTSPLSNWSVRYRTRAGLRLVYRLAQPILPEEYLALSRGVMWEIFRFTELRFDPSSSQWFRCFRLPNVVRNDGKDIGQTWMKPWHRPPEIRGLVVDPDEIPKRAERLPWEGRVSINIDIGVSATNISKPQGDSLQDTKWIRRVLRSSPFFDYIFNNHPIFPGNRDPMLVKIVGAVVDKLFPHEASTPEQVFQLLLPVVERLERDGSEAWDDKLWRLIRHSWMGEEKKRKERQEKLVMVESDREQFFERMLKWLPPSQIPNDPVQRLIYARRHLCLQTPSGAYVIQPDATYSSRPLRGTQLPAHFAAGLSFLVDDGFRNRYGSMISGQDILNQYSTNIDLAEVVPGKRSLARVVERNDRDVLEIVPFAIRGDLLEAAELDKDVDAWIDSFGPVEAQKLRRWASHGPAIDEGGIAALYLHGVAKSGKSLFAMAMAEIFNSLPAHGAAAFHDFNSALLDSPIVMVDEGIPQRQSGMDPADQFRSMVTGSPIAITRKFHDSVMSKIFYRIIFASNSFDMVNNLIGRRTMNHYDREAFYERVFVVECASPVAEFFTRNGDMAFTKYGSRGSWIGGECRLARHILKLYQLEREKVDRSRLNGRLLVSGVPHSGFTAAWDLGGEGGFIVEQLASDSNRVATNKATPMLAQAMRITSTGLWVLKRPYVRILSASSKANSGQLSRALERFLGRRLYVDPETNLTWVSVDADKVTSCATQEGVDASALEALRNQNVYLQGAW